MAIFNSYVKLPEGIFSLLGDFLTADLLQLSGPKTADFPSFFRRCQRCQGAHNTIDGSVSVT